MVLRILQIIAAIGTIVTGLVSLIWPRSVQGFTGLSAEGPRGITEIRAVLGGLFVALGVVPLVLKVPETYRMLGIAYLVVAVVRTISMIVDKSVVQSNVISVVVEIKRYCSHTSSIFTSRFLIARFSASYAKIFRRRSSALMTRYPPFALCTEPAFIIEKSVKASPY